MTNSSVTWIEFSVALLIVFVVGIAIGMSATNLFKGKSRKKIAWIAITLGWLGIHRFKLGNKKEGIINLVITLLPVIPGGIVFFLIGVFEGVKYLRMSDLDFEETYISRKRKWF